MNYNQCGILIKWFGEQNIFFDQVHVPELKHQIVHMLCVCYMLIKILKMVKIQGENQTVNTVNFSVSHRPAVNMETCTDGKLGPGFQSEWNLLFAKKEKKNFFEVSCSSLSFCDVVSLKL